MISSEGRQADWRRKHPQRYAAHLAVQRALKSGELVKGDCAVCGSTQTDGHHSDYSKPLAVTWLCRRHHIRWHKQGGGDLFERGAA